MLAPPLYATPPAPPATINLGSVELLQVKLDTVSALTSVPPPPP
ncbi:hypothetical protein ACFL0U_03995 [Pseudomonadota bacterium]